MGKRATYVRFDFHVIDEAVPQPVEFSCEKKQNLSQSGRHACGQRGPEPPRALPAPHEARGDPDTRTARL